MDKELLVSKYFSGDITHEENAQLEELLATDPELRSTFEFEKQLHSALHYGKGKALKEKLKNFEAEIQAKETKNHGSQSQRASAKKYWLVAASVVILAGIWWLNTTFSGGNLDALYDENFNLYPNTEVVITRGNEENTLEREAFIAYESKEYAQAFEKFSQLSNAYVPFYQAQCKLQMGEYTAAADLFQQNIDTGTKYIPESYWYLAMASLKTGDKSQAQEALKTLIQDFDYHQEKATSLLAQLD
jgi:TolA-binding protein